MDCMEKVRELQDVWTLLFPPSVTITDQQWGIWLLRYDEATIRDGIARTAIKFQKLNGNMDAQYVGRYASSIMRQLHQREAA